MSFKKEKKWGKTMADDFVSFMIFIFKALFLKTLKLQLWRYFSLDGFMNCHGMNGRLFVIYVVWALAVAILKFLCLSIFFMLKTLKIQKNGKNYGKKLSFYHEKGTYT